MIDVLIVEDDESISRPIDRVHAEPGRLQRDLGQRWRVRRFQDARRARASTGGLRFGTCPGMNGIELCRAIRTADFPRYVYFIMLTSHNRSQINDTHAGADDFMGEPLNPGGLIMRANTGKRIIGLETRGMTIFALAKLAQSRDPRRQRTPGTRGRGCCRVLARRLQLKPKFRATLDNEYVQLILSTSSPLHDAGRARSPMRSCSSRGS